MRKSNLTITKSGKANMMYADEAVTIALKDLFNEKQTVSQGIVIK